MGSMSKKPHAVFVPYPAQGHINPLLQFAELLYYRGFHITFVNTEFNHERILNSSSQESVKSMTDFQYKTIPDGLPPSATRDVPALCDSTSKTCLVPFRNLLSKLNDISTSGVPPVTSVVFDVGMSFSLKAAEELGIPGVAFWTASTSSFLGYLQYPHLIDRGLSVAKGVDYLSNRYMHTPIDWAPGMKNIRLKDMPNFDRLGESNNNLILNFTFEQAKRSFEASAIIFHTFEALEREVLEALKAQLPPIYTIGPLQLLLRQITNDGSSLLDSNLWKKDAGCLEWLDSREPNSVLYLNFGSVTVMTPQDLTELAWGLANSKHSFMWVIRPDLITADSAILPPEFLSETKERGLIVSWCSQDQVLNHPSVGGFLTHTGWNSILESVCGGVPMICWPFFAEQQMNCRYACSEWGIGMEIDTQVSRDEVERLVRELMEGEKGKEMKKKARDWKNKAEEASGPGGSSFLNLDKLLTEVLLAKDLN